MEVKRLLLTGSQGAVGTQLVKLLDSCFEIRTQDLKSSARTGHIQGDLSNLEVAQHAVEDTEMVIHLAGGRPLDIDIFQKNLATTQSLVLACKKADVRRCFFASTINIYGQGSFKKSQSIVQPAYLPIDEQMETVPEDDYSLSKRHCEELFRKASLESGLHTLALRLPAVWSEYQTATYRPRCGLALTPTQVIDPWHYLDVRDLARLITAYFHHPTIPRFLCGYITSDDQGSALKTRDVLARDCPEWLSLWESPPKEYQPLFCSKTVSELLDWQPTYRWRDTPWWRRWLLRLRGQQT